MIDTIVKLWPVIAGSGAAAWIVFQWLYKRWTRKRSIEAAKKAKTDELAERALDTARAQTDAARAQADAATAAHMHTLETTVTAQAAEILRLDSALDVAHASEIEAWKRYHAVSGTDTDPNAAGGTA